MKRMINNKGFTFVELMISMAIGGIVLTGVYAVYSIQQRSYTVQDQVAEMQQAGRGALGFMIGEMRMAGYDPPNNYPAEGPFDPDGTCDGATILTAQPNKITFQYCQVKMKENTDPVQYTSELIQSTYALFDSFNDGVSDLGVTQLIDDASLPTRSLADGVEAIEFFYLDGAGNQTGDISKIRNIKISMLIRSSFPDRKYRDETLYQPASVQDGSSAAIWDINGDAPGTGNPPTTDPDGCDEAGDRCHFQRRLLITTVKLRNMGLAE